MKVMQHIEHEKSGYGYLIILMILMFWMIPLFHYVMELLKI
jgi:hypothetical protein